MWQVKSKQEAIDWVKRVPTIPGVETNIEIRQVFEAEDFGPEFTPEARVQEDRLRARMDAKKKDRLMFNFPTRVRTIAVLLAAAAFSISAVAQTKKAVAAKPQVTVYKSPTCGCCEKWVEHMNASGFAATATNMPDVSEIKTKNGVPAKLQSCHTSLVGGYVIEGHVPADDIKRLLKERPAIAGLAAPGMPAGSPGMDVPQSPAYDVIAFDKTGKTHVFATHTPR
jgi:hypothetical protein